MHFHQGESCRFGDRRIAVGRLDEVIVRSECENLVVFIQDVDSGQLTQVLVRTHYDINVFCVGAIFGCAVVTAGSEIADNEDDHIAGELRKHGDHIEVGVSIAALRFFIERVPSAQRDLPNDITQLEVVTIGGAILRLVIKRVPNLFARQFLKPNLAFTKFDQFLIALFVNNEFGIRLNNFHLPRDFVMVNVPLD